MMGQSRQGAGRATRRWIGSTVFVLTVYAILETAHARDLCADINDLIEQSRSQFAEIAAEASDETGDHVATRVLADATYCRITASSEDSAYYCAWAFPYRAEIAAETFDQLALGIGECVGPHATVHGDQGVNHPDFYDVRRFRTEAADVSVSIKDKVALDATYVFVRVHGRTDG